MATSCLMLKAKVVQGKECGMGPTHGWWCNAVTWPTKCPGCGSSVFFFRCNCGSKVFFDEIGSPWPIHDCDSAWAKNLIRTRDKSGAVTVQLAEGVSIRRAPSSFSVDSRVLTEGLRRKRQPKPDPIVAVHPRHGHEETMVVGVLREKQVEVDVLRSLKLHDDTSLSAGFLGPLGKGHWGKVTIHEPSGTEATLNSYTIFVLSEQLQDSRNTRGVTVSVEMAALDIPTVALVWYSRYYDVLG